jgi:DNA-binding response OmpR family regulator
MLALIEGALAGAGLQVEVAAEGRTGLARAAASNPDALVLDWLMPGLDGISLCSAARENPGLATAHIVLVTGRQEPEYAQIATDAGADAVVTKPFDPLVLAESVKAGIRRSRAARRVATLSRTDLVTGLRDERCFLEDLDRLLALQETTSIEIAVAAMAARDAGAGVGAVEPVVSALAGLLGPADSLYRLHATGEASFAIIAPDANEPDLLAAAIESAARRAGVEQRATRVTAMTVGGGSAAEVLGQLRARLEGRFAA